MSEFSLCAIDFLNCKQTNNPVVWKSTIYCHSFRSDNKLQTQTVSREKMNKTLSNNKPAHKMLDKLLPDDMYVHSKFVRQEALGIYYIPWPPKKLLPKICTQV